MQPLHKTAKLIEDQFHNTAGSMFVINLTYPLSQIGYPGQSNESLLALTNLVTELTKKYLLERFSNWNGTITSLHIGQELAWVSVLANFSLKAEQLEKQFRNDNWNYLPTGFSSQVSRANISSH